MNQPQADNRVEIIQGGELPAEQRRRLEGQTMKGRVVRFKNKGVPGSQTMGKVVDEVYIMVGEYKHLIQKIEFGVGVSWDKSRYAYRTGYYTYQYGRKNIKWGQYTQFLTETEYRTLLQKAKVAGWDIFWAAT